MYKPNKIILTAGPSISAKEIAYVSDAVKNGWNFHFNDYVEKFEKKMASYVGVKYAMATSSGTGALHLSLLAMGIKEGDEIIIPEISAVASANVITYVGAKPVFVDIDKDSWCIDPKSFKKAITKKTRAVIPVDLYGHPYNADEINRIAKEHNLFILEDACPSLGATYKGRKTGSLGDIAAYSFQGAKVAVAGEGGMLVTNNGTLFEKASYIADLGRDRKKGAFWHTIIGYKYRLPNVAAALGLAQVERIEFLVERKRKIFNWYKERLGDIDGLAMNTEKKWAKNTYWMSSIVLKKKFTLSRDKLMAKLKEHMIDTRPFFYPFSMLPVYKQATDNKVAYQVGLNGINLPSGVTLTEEQVDYTCQKVKKFLRI